MEDRAARLLAWYDRHRRELPWRAAPGERADPYRVWLSEIMLQQTTVAAVQPYFRAFLARWPNVEALAAASLDDVLQAWQGLGYYARARNLHACAREIAWRRGGRFPDDEAGLRALPGVGPYTAAAFAAIAFGRRATAVDGNVERVMARLHAVETPLPRAKPELRALAAALTPDERCGDFVQAAMELGATVCLPRRPQCILCPWREGCAGALAGAPERFPARPRRTPRPTRKGVAFAALSPDGLLLRRRPERGLLGGMAELPTTEWREEPWDEAEMRACAPLAADWRWAGRIEHVFTHFRLELEVYVACLEASGEGDWRPLDRLGEAALPSVMKKAIRRALEARASFASALPARKASLSAP
jgi:A/G-specific adenine glycosylase